MKGDRMEKTVSATEAKIHLGMLIRKATEQGETVIVTRSGIPRVAIVPFDEFRRMKLGRKWESHGVILRRIRTLKKILHDRLNREGKELPDIEGMIDHAREERDGRIIDSLR